MEDLWLLDIPLFSGLDRIDLAKLIPELERTTFKASEILFRQGDPGSSLFILIDGEADVFLEDSDKETRNIARLYRRECLGEMALLTGESRSAGARAVTDLTVYSLSKERFDSLMIKHHSLAVHFAHVLATRLAAVNASLGRCEKMIGEAIDEEGKQPRKQSLPQARAGPQVRPKRPALAISDLVSRKTFYLLVAVAAVCLLSAYSLKGMGLERHNIILIELLLVATVFWAMNVVSYHVVAVSLPVLAVLFGATTPASAFKGFASPTWFLVLGVFAIAASVSKSGLLYRLALSAIRKFPPNYFGQALALAFSGLVLTPVIPSSNGRAALASPLVLNLSEALRFEKDSPAAVGMAMSCLLGFGHMSFMFMNGTATCFFVLGLLPAEVREGITWGYWLKTAFPLGILFFLFSYISIALTNRPKERIVINRSIIDAQLKTLGPMTAHEKISLLTVVVCLVGFLTQPMHHISEAWVAMLSFLILYGSSVLGEGAIRTDIDWNFLISFGALVGFGAVISSTGLTGFIATKAGPFLEPFAGNKILFLMIVSLAVHLLRFALPIPPAQLISMLSIMPLLVKYEINPFVVGLVVLISSNPWFLPHQNSLYLNVLYGTEQKLFSHGKTVKLAFLHVVVILIAIALSEPYWRYLGLVR